MKVTLIGFMGCGKSTVGKELSKLLNLPFIDLDQEIVERTGKSISELFKILREEGFREIESSTLKELLLKEESFIISAGGGTPAYGKNIKVINALSESVFLKTDFETLWERICRDPNRPLVKLGKEKVRELYFKRLPYYQRAKFTVECDGKSPEEIAREVAIKLSLPGRSGRATQKGQGDRT